MKASLIAVLLLPLMGFHAEAQTISINREPDSNLPEAYSVRLPLRVVESFTVPLGSDTPNTDQSVQLARRQLYKMMQQECSALSESFNAECRIASFNVTLARNFVPVGGNSNATTPAPTLRSVDASVSYGLKVKD